MAITLTTPLTPSELRGAHPAATRGKEDGELAVLLEDLERALRATFRVTGETADVNDALRSALVIAWPSFLQQVRNVSDESVSADGASVSYNREGVIGFRWPRLVGAVLAAVADADVGSVVLASGTTTHVFTW